MEAIDFGIGEWVVIGLFTINAGLLIDGFVRKYIGEDKDV